MPVVARGATLTCSKLIQGEGRTVERLVVSAPFGNYLQFPHTTSTIGTFTREYRGGFWRRLWRVLRTVRYYPGIQAWKNKLGLPNPGIASVRVRCSDKIVSVSARRTDDWYHLLDALRYLRPLATELNVSCPNCPGEPDSTDYEAVYRRAMCQPYRVIVKVPPVGYERVISLAVSQGISIFHCCNTLPTPSGGISGKPLKPLSLRAVEYARSRGARLVIGGGGVTCLRDAQDYLSAGATSVAVGSVLFFPWKWRTVRKMAEALRCPAGTSGRAGTAVNAPVRAASASTHRA